MWHEQALDGGSSSEEIAKLEDEVQELRVEREEAIFAGVTESPSRSNSNSDPSQR
jgi:hypothetical protein